jgi:hypothetical protein
MYNAGAFAVDQSKRLSTPSFFFSLVLFPLQCHHHAKRRPVAKVVMRACFSTNFFPFFKTQQQQQQKKKLSQASSSFFNVFYIFPHSALKEKKNILIS